MAYVGRLDQVYNFYSLTQRVSSRIPFACKERLREERRHRPIVVVGIARPVGVELELAVVPVEDRGLVELAIGVRIIVFARPYHQSLKIVLTTISLLNLIRQHSPYRLIGLP